MAALSGAYRGYLHQDAVTAYLLATLLLPGARARTLSAERRVTSDDCFDDIELRGTSRRRIQVKSHQVEYRPLQLKDFTTQEISFRIDRAVRSFTAETSPADEYRLFATYDPPDETVSRFLEPAQDVSQLLPGVSTQRYRLVVSQIWPEGGNSVWPHLADIGRDIFASFCARFVIEIGCPHSSTDLRQPGPLEQSLLRALADDVGVGFWPNNNRDVADSAAHLIHEASVARATSATLAEGEVIQALGLRIDYGRVPEVLPVDDRRLVRRVDALGDIAQMLSTTSRVAITGSPGIGKSWLLHQLAIRLADEGWWVATHYCFIDLFDADQSLRASIDTIFGSIMFELLERDPSITPGGPRYAAGPRELEKLLDAGSKAQPNRRIAIIVDGLDHADRISGAPTARLATEIADELAGISLPRGAVVIVGSQPGNHLTSFLEAADQYQAPKWPEESIRALIDNLDLRSKLQENNLSDDEEVVVRTIVEKADGSPLYATYLARTAADIAEGRYTEASDIADYLATAPAFDDDLNRYYQWLIGPIEAEPGGLLIIQLLSLLDFSLTRDEIKEILPSFAHLVERVVSGISPVLVEDVGHGGLRVHHESFQRYIREKLEADPQANLEAILRPAIDWLDARGFFKDTRAFRSVLRLLERSGRIDDVLNRVSDNFVDLAVRECQPGDAVRDNLTTAARVASKARNWPVLARLVELARAAENLYEWRFDDFSLAEAYGLAFGTLFGGKRLVARLLHDGRCTFTPRAGLQLCRLCDDAGIIPPWSEYMAAYEVQRASSNTHYGHDSESAISVALLTGRLRLAGKEEAIRVCSEWFRSENEPPFHAREIAEILGRMYGVDAVESALQNMPVLPRKGWALLALAPLEASPELSRDRANQAVSSQLPLSGWLEALKYGADIPLTPRTSEEIDALTDDVLDSHVQFEPDRFLRWFLQIRLWASAGDTVSLMRTEARIPSDSWYRRWLQFCVTLVHPATTADDLIASVRELSKNIEVFVGDPRACDLYRLHSAIRMSFRSMFERLDDARWEEALNYLATISDETNTSLQRARMGPLPVDALCELCLEAADTPAKKATGSALCSRLLSAEQRTNEYYDTHAADQLILARIQAASGQQDIAEKSWREACTYLVAYGYRKDITLWELLDPLKKLAAADSHRTRRCLRDLAPLGERVLVHTDGKETRHAIHVWIDLAAEIHPAGVLSYLARDQISDMPSFGDLDHAIPKCLAALASMVSPVALTAAWIGIEREARQDMSAALAACEKLVHVNRPLGEQLWSVLVASLDGDGAKSPNDLATLAQASAERSSIPVPEIDPESSVPGKENEADSAVSGAASKPGFHDAPSLPTRATPLQIVHFVRRWRDSTSPDLDRVVNSVGWRIVEMVDEGCEEAAERTIQRLARDTSTWEKHTVLPGLAEGLERHGKLRLAALTSTYAYTRSGDGWRRFAGAKGEERFKAALEANEDIAWSTLADEIGEAVADGGPYGVTTHLIELLAGAGRADDAFATWNAACGAISNRLPSVGQRDSIRIAYDEECESAAEMLWSAVIMRVNSSAHQEKRAAALAVFLGIRYDATAFSAALKFAISHDVPVSTLTVVLALVEQYEQCPYEVTSGALAELQSVASMPFVTARVLARSLLERAGVMVAMPASLEPGVALISEQQATEIELGVGRARLSKAIEIWPDFVPLFGTCFEAARASDETKAQMERTIRRFGPKREGRRLALWTPVNEQIERCLQTTGAGVRAALAKRGILDPDVEGVLGRSFLGNAELGIRISLSRTIRPVCLQSPSTLEEGTTVSLPITVECGQLAGWVVLAHQEMQLQIGEGYDHPVTAKRVLHAGIVFREWKDDGGLPLGYPFPQIWQSSAWKKIGVPHSFGGPIAALDVKRDAFSRVEFLAPHPAILIASSLDLASSERGLMFVDPAGSPAVVCINWQRKLIGEEHLADSEPTQYGMALFARPDVFEAVSALAEVPACYVTIVGTSPLDD
jgi:hypothetical protein